ncbi:hypothetical protein QL285_082839 [Trifolium repens]|nr:hypothetical protein QL285_082839 [Trifolium repens]
MSSYHDEGHRAAMNRFSSDFLLLMSWPTSSFHRGTMEAIVSCYDKQHKSSHFLLFLVFCILCFVVMLFFDSVGFPSYLSLPWSIYY